MLPLHIWIMDQTFDTVVNSSIALKFVDLKVLHIKYHVLQNTTHHILSCVLLHAVLDTQTACYTMCHIQCYIIYFTESY